MRRLTPPRIRKVGILYGLFIIPMTLGGYAATRLMLAEPLSDRPNATLELTRWQYGVGEAVQFVLANNGRRTLYVPNDCPEEPLDVYVRHGDQWLAVHANSPTVACDKTRTVVAIEPGVRMTMSYENWSDLFLEPGTYRIVARFDGLEGGLSADFTVAE